MNDDSLNQKDPSGNEPLQHSKWKGPLIAVLCIAGICVAVFFIARAAMLRMDSLSGKSDSAVSGSHNGILPDSVMGYNKIDFVKAVLGQAREKESLVVYEQDVNSVSEISNAFLNWDIFKKTKKIHTYGKGAYTIDMSRVASDSIAVDLDKKNVTVSLPKTTLSYLEVDANRTTFEDTEHAIFGFGDIALTEEQQKQLDAEIRHKMLAELTTDASFKKSDEAGLKKAKEMLQPVVAAVSDEFVVKCVYSDEERGTSEAAETDSVPEVESSASG
jgi:hypothetical protein